VSSIRKVNAGTLNVTVGGVRRDGNGFYVVREYTIQFSIMIQILVRDSMKESKVCLDPYDGREKIVEQCHGLCCKSCEKAHCKMKCPLAFLLNCSRMKSLKEEVFERVFE